jgi:hypothetical protein
MYFDRCSRPGRYLDRAVFRATYSFGLFIFLDSFFKECSMMLNLWRRARFIAQPVARVFVVAVAIASIQAAYGDDGGVEGMKVCAIHDVEIEYLLADSILGHELPAHRYVEASTLRQEARRACNAGQYEDGVKHFSAAAATLGLHLNIAKFRLD